MTIVLAAGTHALAPTTLTRFAYSSVITIRGSGASTCVLAAQQASTFGLIQVQATGVLIEGLTLRGLPGELPYYSWGLAARAPSVRLDSVNFDTWYCVWAAGWGALV